MSRLRHSHIVIPRATSKLMRTKKIRPFSTSGAVGSLTITGLSTDSLGSYAQFGTHATIGFTTDPAGGTITQKWGTTLGGQELGTGANPTAFPSDGILYLEVTRNGEVVSETAAIRYAPGTAPTIANQSAWIVDDQAVNIDGSASGANLTFTYTLSSKPQEIVTDPNTGQITGTVTFAVGGSTGSGMAEQTAVDQYGRTYTDTFNWSYQLRSQGTAANLLPPYSFEEGSAITPQDLSLDFTANGNTLTYAITGTPLPPNLSVNSAGTMSGTPTDVTANAPYTVRGTDEYGRTTDSVFNLEVIAQATGPLLTISDYLGSPTYTMTVTSNSEGTCYWGYYPQGTPDGAVDIPAMIAGTDTNQISNGSLGIFTAAGSMPDVEVPFTGLSGLTTYELKLALDVDDDGATSGYTNVAGQQVTTPELTAPIVTSAATDVAGDTITLTMSETVTGTGVPSEWAVNGVVAGAPTIDSVTVAGTSITLELSGNLVQNGETITVDYTAGDIQDAAGNALASFTGQAVTNNVPAAGLTVNYLGEYTNTADHPGTAFTFTGVDFGGGGEIYVVAQARSRRANSIVIDGNTDAAVIRTNNNTVAQSIGRATGVSSGTGTVVVNLEFTSDTPKGVRIAVYEVIGKTTEVANHVHSNQTPPNDAVFNVLNGDFILGGAGEEGGGSPAVSNMTQNGTLYDYDSNDEGGFWSQAITADNASYTITVTGGARNNAAFVQLR